MSQHTSTRFLNADQAQRALDVDAATIKALVSSGQLTAYDTGKFEQPGQLENYRFKPADLNACKHTCYVSAPSDIA
jgi:hypothetical protein